MMGSPENKTNSGKKRAVPDPFHRLKPGWRANLAVFGLLGMLIITFFYWQIRYAEKTFTAHVNEHASMVAGLIRLNAKGAVASQNVVEEIISTFLENSARFIDYLDAVAAFSEIELTAFASETGLSGIRILEKGKVYREGPSRWLSPGENLGMAGKARFFHLNSLYCYCLPRTEGRGTILVGLSDVRIEAFQNQIGLRHLLSMLPGTGGIRYIRMEKPASPGTITEPIIRIFTKKADKIAEARLSLGDDILVIGLDAKQFLIRVDQLWKEFMVFSATLILSGLFFSWLLLRNQGAYLNQVRNFERRLAKEKEDASLGRASASITHEIRNPLNAISMGLQRLQIEGDELNGEHRELVDNLLKAVKRTDGIISELRRYAGPVTPVLTSVTPDSVIRHIILLYREECNKRGIMVEYRPDYTGTISGDPALLEEAMENLIKNAVEAQPDGGTIFLGLSRRESDIVISMENNGFSLSEDETEKILQPYFTTKTRGSGLGLPIVSRIIRGHGGNLNIQARKPGRLRIDLSIPVNAHGSGVELITGGDHENTCS